MTDGESTFHEATVVMRRQAHQASALFVALLAIPAALSLVAVLVLVHADRQVRHAARRADEEAAAVRILSERTDHLDSIAAALGQLETAQTEEQRQAAIDALRSASTTPPPTTAPAKKKAAKTTPTTSASPAQPGTTRPPAPAPAPPAPPPPTTTTTQPPALCRPLLPLTCPLPPRGKRPKG